MNVPPELDRQTFLANLRQSGLLDATKLSPVLRAVPVSARGRAVARALVEAGLLTRFQAERLLRGRVTGFLLGSYRILEQIGRGGMGRVYRAEHRTMGRIVALKVLAPTLLQTDRALDLFQREVRAIAQLVHPNIVTAFDANEENGRHYLVLEHVEGPNLDQLVRNDGPLPFGVACDIIRQAANGLQAAHAVGMVHRDIKPANILLQRRDPTGPGLVKISDFGLARFLLPGECPVKGTILVKENTVMGTPDYLAPEQARNLHNADIRSDLYSLGCTLYFLLSGRVPFSGGSAMDKLIRHTTDEAAPIRQLRPDVPPAVAVILDRMMAKRPEERFQTPAELAAALEPFAVNGPTPWAPPPTAIPFVDNSPTPGDDCAVGSFNVLDGGVSSDDLTSLSPTLGHDASPTPLTPPEPLLLARDVSPHHRRASRDRIHLAVFLATGAVGALLAAAISLALALGR